MHKVFFRAEDHRYFLDEAMTREVPGVSSLVEHFGLSNIGELKAMGKSALLERKADEGTKIHETLKFLDEDTLATYDLKLEPHIYWWRRFKAEYKADFLLIEEPLVSHVWGFAGTPDRYWLDNLPDIKTGKHQRVHEIKSALYKILIEENFPKFKVKNRFTVEIGSTGYKVIKHTDRNDEAVAKSLLTLYNYKRKAGLLK